MLDNKAHKERSTARTHSNKERPHADPSGTLFLEKGLSDNTRSGASRRANEECTECSADCHGRIRMTSSTANVKSEGSDGTDEPDGATTVTVRERFPEQGSPSENGDLKRREVRGSVQRHAQVFRDGLEGRDDGSSGECGHHSLREC